MFWDRFIELCEKNGVRPTRVAVDCGFSKGTVNNWKQSYIKGVDAKPASKIVDRLAEYFDVTVDYLLERTNFPDGYAPETEADAYGPQFDGCGGDMEKYLQFKQAEANDAMREAAAPPVIKQYMRLDEADRRYVDGVIAGLLQQDKYKATEANLA